MYILNPKNWFLWHIFPHICGSIGLLFPKTIRFTRGWTRTNHVYFMKIISNINILIRNLGTLKRKTWPPPPPPITLFWSGECHNSVISFRNIAKKFLTVVNICWYLMKAMYWSSRIKLFPQLVRVRMKNQIFVKSPSRPPTETVDLALTNNKAY